MGFARRPSDRDNGLGPVHRRVIAPQQPAFGGASSRVIDACMTMNVLSPAGSSAINHPEVTGFYHEQTGSIAYLVVDPSTGHGAVIDPVLDFDIRAGRVSTTSADQILDTIAARHLTIDWILDTHPHADHFSAAAYMKAKLGAPTAIGEKVADIQTLWQAIYNVPPYTTQYWDRLFKDGDTFKVGSLDASVMLCAGHTLASITYVIGDAAFIHDTMFQPDSGTARTDFPGGSGCGAVRFDPAHSGVAGRNAAVHRSRLQAERPSGAMGIDSGAAKA